jgi:hypothetical protein
VNRDAYVVFSMVATNDGSTGISYELISAPPGVGFGTYLEVDHYYTMKWAAFFSWNTPSLAGSTNLFVVRAYDVTDPSIAATGSVSMVVIDVPPISSIQVTNDSAMLQLHTGDELVDVVPLFPRGQTAGCVRYWSVARASLLQALRELRLLRHDGAVGVVVV